MSSAATGFPSPTAHTVGVCFRFRDFGSCNRDHCRFLHVDPREARNESSGKNCAEEACHGRCDRRGCTHLHGDRLKDYNDPLLQEPLSYCDTEGDHVIEGRCKLVWHTAGIDFGGPRRDIRWEFAHTTYVGNGSRYRFRDPDQRHRHEPSWHEYYQTSFSNAHTGLCGVLEANMLECSLPEASGGLSDFEAFFHVCVPKLMKQLST